MAVLYNHADLVRWLEEGAQASVRKEMRRLFQVANRRMQNIETAMKAGRIGFSPAYEAALKYTGNAGRFTKFSMVGDWNKMLEQAAQAVAFVNQPTSTATGARKFQRQLQQGITYRNGEKISDRDMSAFMGAVYGDMDTNDTFKSIAERYILSGTEMQIGEAQGEMDSFIRDYVARVNAEIKAGAEAMADYVDSFARQAFDVLNHDPFHELF